MNSTSGGKHRTNETSRRNMNKERDLLIIQNANDGMKLAELMDKHDLSARRIQQIISDARIKTEHQKSKEYDIESLDNSMIA